MLLFEQMSVHWFSLNLTDPNRVSYAYVKHKRMASKEIIVLSGLIAYIRSAVRLELELFSGRISLT